MTETMRAGPTGPKRPSAIRRPLATSAVAATVAKKRPGWKPSPSKNPAVPASPWPPNHPKSFCEPCAAMKSPSTSRRVRIPESMGRSPFPGASRLRSPWSVNYIKYSYYLSSSYLSFSRHAAILLPVKRMKSSAAPDLALCGRYHRAIELVGRRWTGAIVYLLLRSRCRFATLRDAIPDITDRMLSERLQELEREGIVE